MTDETTWIDEHTEPETQKFVGIAPAPEPTYGGVVILAGDVEATTQDDQHEAAVAALMFEPDGDATSDMAFMLGSTDNDIVSSTAAGGVLAGGSGDDIIISLGGNVLIGGEGNDILDAASGDILRGGAGADIFLLTLGSGVIHVRDFNAGHGDIVAVVDAPADLILNGASLFAGGVEVIRFANADMAVSAGLS